MPLKLMLLGNIASGRTKVSIPVPFMVTEDVTDSGGKVVLPAGTIIYAKVARSRGANIVISAIRQPSRLAISFDGIRSADGAALSVSAENNSSKSEVSIPRGIRRQEVSAVMKQLLEDPQARQTLIQIADVFNGGKSPAKGDILNTVFQKLQMANSAQLLANGSLGNAVTLIHTIETGSLQRLPTNEVALLTGAIREMAGLAGQVTRRASGLLKAPSVFAYVGTPFTVYAALAKPDTAQALALLTKCPDGASGRTMFGCAARY